MRKVGTGVLNDGGWLGAGDKEEYVNVETRAEEKKIDHEAKKGQEKLRRKMK